MSEGLPSRQGMLDLAVRGLRKQGWRQAVSPGGICMYSMPNGDRCAWGHVDPTLKNQMATVISLSDRSDGGLARCLAGQPVGTGSDLDFAMALQRAHDSWFSVGPPGMEAKFRVLAENHGLTFPED